MSVTIPSDLPAVPPPPEFHDLAEGIGLRLEVEEMERLGRYLAALLAVNERFNLTGITDPDEAWTRLVFDSLTLLPFLREIEAKTVLDLGSGGGLPGVPLAIAMPDVKFTLVDATGKKVDFLRAVARDLGLGHVRAVQERAETIGHDPNHRGAFDAVTAKAVGALNILVELAVPLLREGGLLLAIKGAKAPDEVDEAKGALHALHASVAGVSPTPTGTIVAIEKRRPTPKKYPRRPGEPKRSPL